MRLSLTSCLLLLSLCIQCTPSKKTASEDEILIREARIRSNEAIAQHDTIALGEVWTTDYHIISSRNFEISGMENNRHNFAKEFGSKKELLYVRTAIKVEVFPNWNMASETGTWTGQWQEPDGLVKLSGTYLAKWHKLNDQWKIRAEIFVPLSCTGSSFCETKPILYPSPR
jgi:ketosteroid isomerase-like protein